MATITYKLPLEGINHGVNIREQNYQTGTTLNNALITANAIEIRSGLKQITSVYQWQSGERDLGVFSISDIPFVITTQRIVNLHYIQGNAGTEGEIVFPLNLSGLSVEIVDFTDGAGKQGSVFIASDASTGVSRVFRVTLDVSQPQKRLVVTEVTGLCYQASGIFPSGNRDLTSQQIYLVQNPTTDSLFPPPPAQPAANSGAINTEGDVRFVSQAPSGWTLGNGQTSTTTPVSTIPTITKNQRLYASYFVYDSSTNTWTWTTPRLAIQGVGYIDSLLTHDGRLVFVDRITQTMFFSTRRESYIFNGNNLSASLVPYPLGSFIPRSSSIVDIASSSVSGSTGTLSLNLFIMLASGQLLTFSGSYPPQVELEAGPDFGKIVSDGANTLTPTGGGFLPAPISTNSKVFVGYKNDIMYLSTQGVLSVMNTLKLGTYDKLNIGIQNDFDALAKTGLVNIVTSPVFFTPQNVILLQVNETTYVYNTLADGWTTWTLPTKNCRLVFSGGQLYALDTNQTDIYVYTAGVYADSTITGAGSGPDSRKTLPVQLTVRVGYNPIDDDLYSYKLLQAVLPTFYGGNCTVNVTVRKDFDEFPINTQGPLNFLPTKNSSGWASVLPTDTMWPDPTSGGKWVSNTEPNTPTSPTQPTQAQQLVWSTYKTTGAYVNTPKFSQGFTGVAFSIEFDITSQEYFQLVSYDIVYRILRTSLP